MLKNHFDLFGLPVAFNIDTGRLDQAYRQLQARIHPDRYATGTDSERLRSLQAATETNEAYQTLKDPLSRARYLLHLNGIDTQEESNTTMPAEFLMRQMEWREAIEEARSAGNIPALENLGRALRHEAVQLKEALGAALDLRGDYRSEERRVGKECRSRWSPYH